MVHLTLSSATSFWNTSKIFLSYSQKPLGYYKATEDFSLMSYIHSGNTMERRQDIKKMGRRSKWTPSCIIFQTFLSLPQTTTCRWSNWMSTGTKKTRTSRPGLFRFCSRKYIKVVNIFLTKLLSLVDEYDIKYFYRMLLPISWNTWCPDLTRVSKFHTGGKYDRPKPKRNFRKHPTIFI